MNLGDMLTMLRRDVLHDRSDLVDGDDDKLWSDSTLVFYLNEAQRRFARRSFCIRDSSSPATRFTTVPFQREYALDPSIFSVLSARSLGNGGYVGGRYQAGTYSGELSAANPFGDMFTPAGVGTNIIYPDDADLGRGGHNLFDANLPAPTRFFFDINQFTSRPPSKPVGFDTDEGLSFDTNGSGGVVNMRLYPTPSDVWGGSVIQLRVARLPVDLTVANLKAASQIPVDYHLYLLDYAAYLALRIVDHELGDPDRAADFLKSFETHVEEARIEIMRKMFAPQGWGFGRNGYTYVGN